MSVRILLYNPISGHGHMDEWHAMFASILLQRGYTVYCFTFDTEALLSRLRQRGMEQHPNVAILPCPDPYYASTPAHAPGRHFKERVYNSLRGISSTYVKRLQGSHTIPDMPWMRRCKKRLAQLLLPPVYTVFAAIRQSTRFEPSVGVTQAVSDAEAGYLSPEDWGRRMKNTLQTLPPGRYFLFNMFMDMYKTDKSSWKEFARHCRLPWSGLRVNPSPMPREAYYALPAMRGMCLLDEALCRTYAAVLPKKRFACLPDVAVATVPTVPPAIARTITRCAAGRKVVFMGGSIGGQKNITQWGELIRLADPQRFFFAQIGEIHYGACSQEEQGILRALAADPPENFFIHERYLPDERDFNACIAASHIIFAVYKDFRNSSNMPGKAAAFAKPILVSDRYLMGERIQHYGLGAAVPEDNATAILAALERLIQSPPAPENFAAYNAEHNEEAMGLALKNYFDACQYDTERENG